MLATAEGPAEGEIEGKGTSQGTIVTGGSRWARAGQRDGAQQEEEHFLHQSGRKAQVTRCLLQTRRRGGGTDPEAGLAVQQQEVTSPAETALGQGSGGWGDQERNETEVEERGRALWPWEALPVRGAAGAKPSGGLTLKTRRTPSASPAELHGHQAELAAGAVQVHSCSHRLSARRSRS